MRDRNIVLPKEVCLKTTFVTETSIVPSVGCSYVVLETQGDVLASCPGNGGNTVQYTAVCGRGHERCEWKLSNSEQTEVSRSLSCAEMNDEGLNL